MSFCSNCGNELENDDMGALGLFNDDFNYMKKSQSTIARIEHQAENTSTIKGAEGEDLYQEDVRLIAKDGKLFYLPHQKAVETLRE